MTPEDNSNWVRVCEAWAVQPGEIHPARLPDDTPIALYCIGDRYFATADTCTHADASLSCDGTVKDGLVVCNWHDGAFDIASGNAVELPCVVPLRTYAVEVRGEDLFVLAPTRSATG